MAAMQPASKKCAMDNWAPRNFEQLAPADISFRRQPKILKTITIFKEISKNLRKFPKPAYILEFYSPKVYAVLNELTGIHISKFTGFRKVRRVFGRLLENLFKILETSQGFRAF